MRFLFVSIGVVIVFTTALFLTASTSDVDALTPTPSPAPSKTPTPVSTDEETEVTPEVSSEDEDSDSEDLETSAVELEEPFTQADLEVLTGNVQRPNGIQWHNGNLYTACNGDWTLYEIGAESGDTITYSYGVKNAHALYVEDVSESLLRMWIPDYEANAMVTVSGQSSPETVVEGLEGPWGIAYLDESHFLVTTLLSNEIVKVSREGESEVLMSEMRSPTGVAMNDERVFVANNGSARRSIEWIDREALVNGEEPSPQPLVSGLQSTTGLVLAEDGMLYFAYSLGTRGVVGRIDPTKCAETGGCTNNEVELVLYTELAAPLAGLSISPDMKLYVHTIYRPEIYWIDLDGSSEDGETVAMEQDE